MKIVYLGTPDFAVEPLKAIYESGKHDILAVVTNPDKPVGRKRILTECPVKKFASKCGLSVLNYDKIKVEGVEDLRSLQPDIMVTCAFGQILSQEILDIPKYGVINIHASLLPKYRGASPIHYAIKNGETVTGITIMKTDIGIDTGDIILQKSVSIGENETCGELFDRLSVLGAEAVLDALARIESNTVEYKKQDEELATYTHMIKKEDAKIDWTLTAEEIVNTVRAFNPAPVAYTIFQEQQLKIFKAEQSCGSGRGGEVISVDGKLEVACGKNSILIERLQKAGGNPMDVKDFLRGCRLNQGDFFS